MNFQELHFHVVLNQDKLQELVKITQEGLKKIPQFSSMASNPIIYGSQCIIVMTCKKDKLQWAKFDSGAAAQNMMIAADMLGLSTVPLGVMTVTSEEWVKALGVPDEELLLTVAIGYKEDGFKPEEKKIVSEVHYIE